jgi:hypothetical protein
LFRWLGDPFGNLDAPGQAAAAPADVQRAAARAPRRGGFPLGKALLAGLVVWLAVTVSAGWGAAVAAVLATVLWTWPSLGQGRFALLLGVLFVATLAIARMLSG